MKLRLILAVTFLIVSNFHQALNAQTYPLEIQVNLPAPYPSNLDAYADYLEYGVFQVTNTNPNSVEAYFSFLIKENSGLITISSNGILSTPVEISSGVNILTPSQVQGIFTGFTEDNLNTAGLSQAQRDAILLNRQLPEGSYTICITAFDAVGNPLSDPDGMNTCQYFDIYYAERPIILNPIENESFLDTDPIILFNWDQVIYDPTALGRIEYILKIIDITEQEIKNPTQAMLDPGVLPDYEQNIGTIFTMALQNTIDINFISGHQYAARVTSIDPDNLLAFKEGGHSEVVVFEIDEEKIEPIIANAPKITNPKNNDMVESNNGVQISFEHDFLEYSNSVLQNLPYQITIQDVSNINQNQIAQSFTNNAQAFYQNDINYVGEFIKLSTEAPFKIGHRYAAQITLKDTSMILSPNTIENEGKSNIVVFTYGDINNDFQPELDTLLHDYIQGQIFWAFRESEENNESSNHSFIVSNENDLTTASATTINPSYKVGQNIHPLRNAQLVLTGEMNFFFFKSTYIIGAGIADQNGKYAIKLNNSYLSLFSNFKLIAYSTKDFNMLRVPMKVDQTDFGYLMEPLTLTANSTQLSVQVFNPDIEDHANLTVNLLLQSDNFNSLSYWKQIAPDQGNQTVEYNNDSYTVCHTFNDGDWHKSIFQNSEYYQNYVFEVKVNGKPSAYYPMQNIYMPEDNYRVKSVPKIKTNLIYNIANTLKGVVYFGHEVRRDMRVEIKLDPNDIEGIYDTNMDLIRMTDENGRYEFDNLPHLKNNSEIELTITDYSIRNKPFVEKVKYVGVTPIIKDIYLKNDVYTAIGRLVDQYGLPVSNALITVDSSYTTKSTNEGFYMIKINHPYNSTVNIVADGYEQLSIDTKQLNDGNSTVGEVLAFSDNINESQKPKEWKLKLESTQLIQDYYSQSIHDPVDARTFNIGDGSLENKYQNYFSDKENLSGVIGFSSNTMTNTQGIARIHAYYNDELVNAKIQFTANEFNKTDLLTSGQYYSFSAPEGKYYFSITPVAEGPSFVQFFAEINMADNYDEDIDIYLQTATQIKGKVYDKSNRNILPNATVTIEGLEYNATTDDSGSYTLYIPLNDEYRCTAKLSKYNRQDTSIFVQDTSVNLDFYLEPRDPNFPDFKTMSGFAINVDNMEAVNDGFLISGELTLSNNKLFSATQGNQSLSFIDVVVKEDSFDAENAVPSTNFYFENAEVKVEAFEFAPVLVTGSGRIQLQKLVSSNSNISNKAVIGNTSLKLLFDSDPAFKAFPFTIPTASLRHELKIKNGDYQTGVDATLQEEKHFEKVFVTPNSSVPEISDLISYKVVFDTLTWNKSINIKQNSDSTRYNDYVTSDFLLFKILIQKDSSTLNKYGINMAGALELPHIIGAKFKLNDDRLAIKRLTLNKNFSIQELSIAVTESDPLKMSIKTWEAILKRIDLYGLGTPNYGLGFGGQIVLKDDKNMEDGTPGHLDINKFSVIKQDSGVSITADLSLRPKGIKVGPLKISQATGKSIFMQYVSSEKSFEIKSSNLKLELSSSNKLAKKVFPLEILNFNMKSKDWSVLLVMKPNLNFDFGVIQVQVDKFLLNYGYDMSINSMESIMQMSDEEREQFFNSTQYNKAGISADDAAYLRERMALADKNGYPLPQESRDALASYDLYMQQLSNKFGTDQLTAGDIELLKAEVAKNENVKDSPELQTYRDAIAQWESKQSVNINSLNNLNGNLGGDQLIPDSKISWAIGIAGGITITSAKGINCAAHASVLLARNNDEIDFRINEILLHLEQPSFKMDVGAKLAVSGSKIGFEAQGELETLKRKFAGSLKFYKYESGGIELGASILVSANITTGPITWHSIGGGFDFNTYSQQYKVFVMGSAGPVGTPKEVASVDDVKLSILFDFNKCGGQPIVEGSGNFVSKGQKYGSVYAKLDFCRMSAYLDINSRIDFAAGLVSANIGGTIYVFKDGDQGRAYIGLYGSMTDKFGIFKANGLLAVGVNFKKDYNTPAVVSNTYDKLPYIAKRYNRFHGIVLALSASIPSKNGSFGIKVGSLDIVSFNYYANASASAHIYKSFDSSTFEVAGDLNAGAGGNIKLLGSTFIGGDASANLKFKGGYDYSWHFEASGNLNMQVYNKSYKSCNSCSFGTYTSCSSVKYPCGKWWCLGLCEWCCCKDVCLPVPNLIPDFKVCFNASFSFSKRQGQSTNVSFTKS
ncbi:MAG: carboxypeptidase regulatory-like domain-containing protein [Saprospiraceae bacterium]